MWIRACILNAMLLAVLLGMAGCASTGQPPVTPAESVATPVAPAATTSPIPTPTATPTTSSAEDYRIGSQDLLELQVFGVADLNRTVRVNSRGYISLPLIGLVQAAGLTSEQLEEALVAKLAKDYLQNPQVSVFIKEFTSQRVTVEGAVKKPGVYPLKGRTTLLQSLAIAEGITTIADPSAVKVFRTKPDGSRETLMFDLEMIREGSVRDPEVRNDDIVQVGESQGKAVAKSLIEFILPFRFLSPAF